MPGSAVSARNPVSGSTVPEEAACVVASASMGTVTEREPVAESPTSGTAVPGMPPETGGAAEGGAYQAFMAGFCLPWKGAGLLLRNRKVKRIAVLPFLVNCIVYAVALGVFFHLLAQWRVSEVAWSFWWGTGAGLSWIVNSMGTILKWMIGIPLALLASYFTFTTIGMLLASPFNDILSQRLERVLCEEETHPPQTWRFWFRSTCRSAFDSLRIVLRQAFWCVLCLPLLLLPAIGFLPLFLVCAYYTGVGFLDVGMARNLLCDRHKRPAIRRMRWSLFGLGVAMELTFLIPFAGLVLMPVGVASGTLLYCRIDWARLFREHGWAYPAGFIPPRLRQCLPDASV